MKKTCLIFTVIFLLGIFLAGCSERDNPADFPRIKEGKVFTYPRAYSTISNYGKYQFLPSNDAEHTFYSMFYAPPDYTDYGTPRPILYLLHDFDGDEGIYFGRMLQRIADSLVHIGEINQFYIVTLDASTAFGGSWYASNDYFGHFEEMVANQLRQFIEDEVPQLKVIQRRNCRAIGGFGMGGYGALKLAAKHPELYSSVATSNCAGIFGGDTTNHLKGVQYLIPKMLEEQNLTIPIQNFATAFDTTSGWRHTMPNTLLFFSMAQAFSPHPLVPGDQDDSTTFLPSFGLDLPFDANGNIYQQIWNKWLAGDLTSILNAHHGDFDSIALYMECGDADQYYFNDQAVAVKNLCQSLNINFQWDTYSGYSGYPATNQRFIYDRLVKMLKFFSAHLETEL